MLIPDIGGHRPRCRRSRAAAMCRYPAAETLGQVSLGVMSVQEAAAVVIGLRMISIEANAMKLLAGVLAAILLLASAGGSHAVVRIANDRGGHIGRYVDRYENCATPEKRSSSTAYAPRPARLSSARSLTTG